MKQYVIFFDQINHASISDVGGKGANLGEMKQARFPVPDGFCVTTHAYKDFIATSSSAMKQFFAELDALDVADLEQLQALGKRIRSHLQQVAIPEPIREAVVQAWNKNGQDYMYAIRSSATAEDLPNASFAGQQDTYLSVKGQEPLLAHIRLCWASLFTDRAISYRVKNGFNHRDVYISIVVQRMVTPDIAGVMFTADPITGNRNVVSIEAIFGLGEALVSGLVLADLYKIKNHTVISRKIAKKKLAIYSLPDGGTITKDLQPNQQEQPTLNDCDLIELAALGKHIQRHYGRPQDIEYCMADGEIFIVQSRPITTLFPLPEDLQQQPLRVLLSFGHLQMMTNAMKPLGLSVLKDIFTPKILKEAGGRIFLDVTDVLHDKVMRKVIPNFLLNVDEAMSRAVETIIKKPEFLAGRQATDGELRVQMRKLLIPLTVRAGRQVHCGNPRQAREKVEQLMEKRITHTKQALSGVQGVERMQEVRRQLDTLFADFMEVFEPWLSGHKANELLKRIMGSKLSGEEELLKLNKSLPGNITSEMGLQLGDLADMLRDLPEVQDYLTTAVDETFYTELDRIPGGKKFRIDFEQFIAHYGMRCPGEIDLTIARWSEAPTHLVASLLGHIRSLKPGQHRQRFAEGEQEAEEATQRILQAFENTHVRKKLVKRLITVYRHMEGLREHHKYLLVSVMAECKKAIMAEADVLVEKGVLLQAEDAHFLNLDDLMLLVEGQNIHNVHSLIAKRKEQYQWHQTLKPPRVMTNEGEIVQVPGKRNLSANTLVGTPVSPGVVEGVAHVILRVEDAMLSEGEILIAPHTDPGWTPLFQSAVAIITEAGGLLTHGAVIAREYGIPAVVGVDNATTLIRDGQKIRVDGVQGLVEILE